MAVPVVRQETRIRHECEWDLPGQGKTQESGDTRAVGATPSAHKQTFVASALIRYSVQVSCRFSGVLTQLPALFIIAAVFLLDFPHIVVQEVTDKPALS